jgi:flagellar protein FlbD
MIVFKRLGGDMIALNPDLIERAEATPDTVVTMVDETKFLVEETLEEVLTLITDYRAYVIARSNDLTLARTAGRPTLHVVPNELIASTEITETHGVDPEGLDLEFEGVEVSPVDLAFESVGSDDGAPEGLVHLEFGRPSSRSVLEGEQQDTSAEYADGVDLVMERVEQLSEEPSMPGRDGGETGGSA